MKGSKTLANYRVEDESEWFIRGGSYFEKTIRQELICINGDAGLVEEIKNIYIKNEPREWHEWKIIKLTTKEFIIKTKGEDGFELRLEMKKIF